MSEFKVGDEVYYVSKINQIQKVNAFPGVLDCTGDYYIEKNTINGFYSDNGVPVMAYFDGDFMSAATRHLLKNIFKTKQEAIDAMIKRLQEIK